MTPEEHKDFKKILKDVDELNRAIIGTDREDYSDGLIFRLRRQEEHMRLLQEQYKSIKSILKGLAIGFIVAAAAFGYFTLKDVINIIK